MISASRSGAHRCTSVPRRRAVPADGLVTCALVSGGAGRNYFVLVEQVQHGALGEGVFAAQFGSRHAVQVSLE
jgi:hypothetical protein